MTSKGRDLYRTFKRSISSSVNEVLSSGQSSSSNNGARYGGGSGKTWIHPPDVLLNGRVEYSVKFLGSQEVKEAKGTDTIRDAIHAIRFQLQVKRSETGHSGAKLQKVDIQINVEGVIIVDSKTKMVLHRYPLQKISFCADDKQDKRVFSFIAKSENEPNRHDCFVFLSDKMAEQITLTVGEAFDLAYKRYMDKNKTSLENQKQVFVLRKRIAELESENQVLSERLAEAINNNKVTQMISLLDAPALPLTPVPSGPPPGVTTKLLNHQLYTAPYMNSVPASSDPFADLVSASSQSPLNTVVTNGHHDQPSPIHSSPSGPAPSQPPPPCPTPSLAPPPPVAPRRTIPPRNSAPEVGRRLENLQLAKMEDIFDDSFNPRANEKSKNGSKEYDPFGDDFLDDVLRTGDVAARVTVSKAEGAQPTPDDFQAMIDKVDKRLAEMSSGFSGGKLEIGEVSPGESFRDLEDGEYGNPVDAFNSNTTGTVKK